MRGLGRVFRACASTTSIISSRYFRFIYLYIQIPFINFIYLDSSISLITPVLNNWTIQSMDPGNFQPVDRMFFRNQLPFRFEGSVGTCWDHALEVWNPCRGSMNSLRKRSNLSLHVWRKKSQPVCRCIFFPHPKRLRTEYGGKLHLPILGSGFHFKHPWMSLMKLWTWDSVSSFDCAFTVCWAVKGMDVKWGWQTQHVFGFHFRLSLFKVLIGVVTAHVWYTLITCWGRGSGSN